MSLFLSLESALADARSEVEKSGEALHDAAVAAAKLKADYDFTVEQVRRLEGALSALHGAAPAAPSAPAPAARAATPPAPPKPDGPECVGCGEKGKIERVNGNISACTVCNAQYVG